MNSSMATLAPLVQLLVLLATQLASCVLVAYQLSKKLIKMEAVPQSRHPIAMLVLSGLT